MHAELFGYFSGNMNNTLYIIEFDWQIEIAKSAALEAGVVIIAANPMMDYALERTGVRAMSLTDSYSHSDFWPCTRKTLKLTDGLAQELDLALRDVDKRFKDGGLEAFKYLNYVSKINLDQIICYLFQIRQAIKKHKAGKIVVAGCDDLHFDDYCLFDPAYSVVGCLLGEPQVQHELGVDAVFHSPPSQWGDGEIASGSFSFGQPRVDQLGVQGKNVLRWGRRLVRHLWHNLTARGAETRVLSIHCKELDALSNDLQREGVRVDQLFAHDAVENQTGPYQYERELIERLEKAGGLAAVNFEGISLGAFTSRIISAMTRQLEPMLALYGKMQRRLRSERYDLLAVQTLSPFDFSSITARESAEYAGINTVCWMHGGYGAYYSLPGYDVSDYRFTREHLVYGQAVKDVLEAEQSVLRYNGAQPDLDICVGGSPYFATRYADYVRPRNERKTVLLTIGGVYGYNQFYFGYDRPAIEAWNWRAHRQIIEALAPFREKYRIVIKDYPSSEMRGTWDDLVADLGGGIEVITTEQSYEEAVVAADVLIYSWVSTSFIEGLLTDADMLLFDDSKMSDQAASLLEKDIVFERQLDKFVERMTAYLDKGELYGQQRDELKAYFCADTSATVVADFLKSLK